MTPPRWSTGCSTRAGRGGHAGGRPGLEDHPAGARRRAAAWAPRPTRSSPPGPTTPRTSPPRSSWPAPSPAGARPHQEGRRAERRRGWPGARLVRRGLSAVPELPEVEVVRRGLEQWVAGRTVARAEVHHPRAVRRQLEGADEFGRRWPGARSTAAAPARQVPVAADGRAGRRAPAGRSSAHLGMSGQLLVEKPSPPDETHLRARFTFTDGGRELRFVDQRTFGWLVGRGAGAGGDEPCPVRLAHIAIDPLDAAFDVDALRRRAAPPAHRGQAGAAGPDAGRRRRQHLRRRGAVARPAARRPADR